MSFDAGTLVTKFTADTAEFMKGVNEAAEHVNKFSSIVEGLAVVELFKKAGESIIDCVQASADLELNMRRLSGVITAPEDLTKFEKLSEHLAKITTYSSKDSLRALADMGKIGLDDQQMASLLSHVQDFAAFTGKDLPDAAEAIARAAVNGSRALKSLGLGFNDAQRAAFEMATQDERVAMLVEQLGSKMEGIAKGAAGTGTGAITNFSKAIEGLKEALGALLEKPVAAFFETITHGVEKLTTALKSTDWQKMFLGSGNVAAMQATYRGGGAGPTGNEMSLVPIVEQSLTGGYGKKHVDGMFSHLGQGADFAKWNMSDSFLQSAAGKYAIDSNRATALGNIQNGFRTGNFMQNGVATNAVGANGKSVNVTPGLLLLEGAADQLAARLGPAASSIKNVTQGFMQGGPAAGMAELGVELLSRTKGFAELQQRLSTALTSLANILNPVMDLVLIIVDTVTKVYNFIIDKLADFVNKFFGDAAGDWIRGARIADAATAAAGAMDAAAKGAKDLATNLEGVNSLNLPAGFKVEQARFDAIQRGMGDPGTAPGKSLDDALKAIDVMQNALPGKPVQSTNVVDANSASLLPSLTQAGPKSAIQTNADAINATLATTPKATDGIAGIIATARTGVVEGALQNGTAVTIQTVNVQPTDPENFVNQVLAKVANQAYVQTGTTGGIGAFGASLRQIWGK